MIGDGCLLYYPEKRVYGIEITGNSEEEQNYYLKISKFLKAKFNKTPRVYTKIEKSAKSLKLVLYGKDIAEILIQHGIMRNKTYTVKIKEEFLEWNKSKHILRGIFETDGSLYFSKVGKISKIRSYPRLSLKTSSIELAKQLKRLLKERDFRVHSYIDGKTNIIYLSGKNMLKKWIKEIGFNSEKNLTKYALWKKLGYYIPRTSLKDRKDILNSAS